MLNVRLANDHLYGKLLFTWLSLVVSMVMSFCPVLFPTRCLGWDLELNWVSFWGFSFLLFQLCKSCSGLCNPWENLWFGAIIWNNCSKVLEACYSAQLLPLYLYLSGCHWRCLSSVWSSPHWSPSYTLCRFCRDFLLGLLAPALPQLEHLCHQQICNISAAYANLPGHQTWSVREKCWRGWVTEDILALLRLLFWTILLCCHSSGLHL